LASRLRGARNFVIGAAIFAVVFVLAFRYLAIYHKSLVWIPDGADQHFPALYYFNRIVRGFLKNPGGGFPFWSWDLGLGADTIGALSFYVLGDPFALISLLFPMRSMELAYMVLFVVRIAAAGAFSAMYLRKMGARSFATLAGSLVYSFTTFTIYSTMHHPMWATGLALFPLLLLGAEFALERRRHWVLVLAVFLSAVGNYYFFYMGALTLVLYAVARYFELTPRETRWRDLLPQAARVAGCVVLGVLFAGPLLFPSAAAVLDTARRQVAATPHLLFSVREYGRMLAALVSTAIGPNSVVLGFAPLALLLVPALFMRRGNSALKVMLIAFPLFMASPLASSIYNALTFPTGRFGFHWLLFLALGVALLLSDDTPFSGRELVAMIVAYALMWALVFSADVPIGPVLYVPCAVGVVTWTVLAAEWWFAPKPSRRAAAAADAGANPDSSPRQPRDDWAVPVTRWVVLGMLVAGIAVAATLSHGASYGNYLKDNIAAGQVLKTYLDEPGAVAASIDDSAFYRVMDSDPAHYNDALVQRFRSTAYYFSVLSAGVTNFIVDNDIRGGWSSFTYSGLDDRAALGELAAAKYYVAAPDRAAYVPFGYRLLEESRKGNLYLNEYALPVGFLYDATISRTAFEALPLVERQQAMLESAVVEDGAGLALPSVAPSVTVVDVPFSYEATGAVADLAAGRIEKLVANSRLDLRFSAPAGSELYIHFDRFDDVPSSPMQRKDALLGKNPTPEALTALELKDRLWWQPLQLRTWYAAGGPPKAELWQTPAYPYYWGNRTQLVNLGYKESVATTASVRFEVPGTLTFKSLKLLAVPMADYAARVEKLRASAMRDISVGNGLVRGTITAEKPALLFLSVPYSSGWRAYVDGKPARTMRVNSAFIGVPVEAGQHSVALRYATPGLAAGVAGLAAACVLALGAWVLGRARRRSRAPREAATG